MLDDRIVAERIADLQQDAALSWHDPAYLRRLGRAAVGELRYQGERRGWDESRTDGTVRQGLSDLYAGAVEQAIGQDPDRAAKFYEHARDVIQPERQAAVERRIERAREEQRVTEIVSRLSETPDDPARRPDLDDYQMRAMELTPPDASPEVRAQVSRMARLEHVQADRAWQAARGRAAVAALDWLGKNPGTRLLAMPPELRDGLSPEQTDALDRVVANGGRPVTDGALQLALDGLAMRDPVAFAALDLAQHRLSLDDGAYGRMVGFQKAIVEGRSDPAFERHRLGRTFLDETLCEANTDPDGAGGDVARERLDHLLGAFEAVEGRPPTMAGIRGLVGDAVRPPAGDPNIVRVNAPIDDGQVVQPQESVRGSQGIAPNVEQMPGSPEYEAAARRVPVDSGIAPNVEPVPGSPEFQAAMTKAATGPHEGEIVILLNGETVLNKDSKTGLLMSPVADLSAVAAAGRETFWKAVIDGLMNPKNRMAYGRELVRKDLAQGRLSPNLRSACRRQKEGKKAHSPARKAVPDRNRRTFARSGRTEPRGRAKERRSARRSLFSEWTHAWIV